MQKVNLIQNYLYGEYAIVNSSASCQLLLTEPSCVLSCFLSLLSIDCHLSAVAFSIVFLVLPSAEPRESHIAALSPASAFSQQKFSRKPTFFSTKLQPGKGRKGVLKSVRSFDIYSASTYSCLASQKTVRYMQQEKQERGKVEQSNK